jgi:hypothetical protein
MVFGKKLRTKYFYVLTSNKSTHVYRYGTCMYVATTSTDLMYNIHMWTIPAGTVVLVN